MRSNVRRNAVSGIVRGAAVGTWGTGTGIAGGFFVTCVGCHAETRKTKHAGGREQTKWLVQGWVQKSHPEALSWEGGAVVFIRVTAATGLARAPIQGFTRLKFQFRMFTRAGEAAAHSQIPHSPSPTECVGVGPSQGIVYGIDRDIAVQLPSSCRSGMTLLQTADMLRLRLVESDSCEAWTTGHYCE